MGWLWGAWRLNRDAIVAELIQPVLDEIRPPPNTCGAVLFGKDGAARQQRGVLEDAQPVSRRVVTRRLRGGVGGLTDAERIFVTALVIIITFGWVWMTK